MASTYVLEGVAYATRPLQEAVRLAADWARRAVEIDADDAEAQATMAWTALMTGNTEVASEQAVIGAYNQSQLSLGEFGQGHHQVALFPFS